MKRWRGVGFVLVVSMACSGVPCRPDGGEDDGGIPADDMSVVLNGGFESWSTPTSPPSGWTVTYGPAWGISFSRTDESYSGTYAIRLQELNNLAVQVQSDDFPAPHGARLFAWARWSTPGRGSLIIGAQWLDQTGAPFAQDSSTVQAGDSEWHRVELAPTPPEAVMGRVKIGKQEGSPAYALIDVVGVLR